MSDDTTWSPGRYTLTKLAAAARTQVPALLRSAGDFPPGFSGTDRVGGRTRLAVQLRLARLMGCPVCAKLFPPLAERAGLDPTAIESAAAGRPDGLSDTLYGAVAWAGAVIAADGDTPAQVPAAAQVLSEAQRRHLQAFMRLELVVHATGLMFLPHAWIERARS